MPWRNRLLNSAEDAADSEKDRDDWTLLHSAAWKNARKTARLLLSLGADVQVENKNGSTPQALAAKAGHLKMSRWLQRSASASHWGVTDSLALLLGETLYYLRAAIH